MNFFVEDFFETAQARVAIFVMLVGDNLLYRGIESLTSSAYSFLYISDFLSFHTLNKAFLSKISQQSFRIEYSYLYPRFETVGA